MTRNTVALSLALVAAPLAASAQTPAYPPPPPLEQPPPPPPGQPVYAQPGQPVYAQPGQPVYAQPGQPVYAQPNGYRLSRPVLVPYEEGTPVPPNARLITRPRIGLVVAGATIFGSLWLLTAMVGTIASDESRSSSSQPELWLVLPVFGPFAYMAAEDRVSTTAGFWLALDGLAQGAGLAMLIAGVVRPGQYLAYDRVAARPPSWMVAPGFAGGPGASFRMTF